MSDILKFEEIESEEKSLSDMIKELTHITDVDENIIPTWCFIDTFGLFDSFEDEEIIETAIADGYNIFDIDKMGELEDLMNNVIIAAPELEEEQILSDLKELTGSDEVSIKKREVKKQESLKEDLNESKKLTEGTANFRTQKDFDMYVISDAEAVGLEEWEEEEKTNYENGDYSYFEMLFSEYYDDVLKFISELEEEYKLEYFNLSLKGGYYEGLQSYVYPKCNTRTGRDYERDDVEDAVWDLQNDLEYYDGKSENEAEAEAKEKVWAEVEKINKEVLPRLKEQGMYKVDVSARFSNGETIYSKVEEAKTPDEKLMGVKEIRDAVIDDTLKGTNVDVEVVKKAADREYKEKDIADFLKGAVESLVIADQGCSTYKLDDRLAICVGWLPGYGKEKRDDVIQSVSEPDYALNAGVKVWTSDSGMLTDYEFINMPYRKNGEVIETDVSIEPDEDYDKLAEYLLSKYEEVKDLEMTEDGEIIEESANKDAHEDENVKKVIDAANISREEAGQAKLTPGEEGEIAALFEENKEPKSGPREELNDFGLDDYYEESFKSKEPKLETFDEQMDFLAKDEQEAIDGYEKVLALVEDEHVKEQLNKILIEEKAHKEFLEKVKKDKSLVYSHEEHEEEQNEGLKEGFIKNCNGQTFCSIDGKNWSECSIEEFNELKDGGYEEVSAEEEIVESSKEHDKKWSGIDSSNHILIRADKAAELGIDPVNHATVDPELNKELKITDFDLGEDNWVIIGQDEDDYEEIKVKLGSGKSVTESSSPKIKFTYICDPSGLEGEVEAESSDKAYEKIMKICAAKGLNVSDELIDIKEVSDDIEEDIEVVTDNVELKESYSEEDLKADIAEYNETGKELLKTYILKNAKKAGYDEIKIRELGGDSLFEEKKKSKLAVLPDYVGIKSDGTQTQLGSAE